MLQVANHDTTAENHRSERSTVTLLIFFIYGFIILSIRATFGPNLLLAPGDR